MFRLCSDVFDDKSFKFSYIQAKKSFGDFRDCKPGEHSKGIMKEDAEVTGRALLQLD